METQQDKPNRIARVKDWLKHNFTGIDCIEYGEGFGEPVIRHRGAKTPEEIANLQRAVGEFYREMHPEESVSESS